MEGLFLDGSIATFGYWDAQHSYSAALILVMSAVMKPSTVTSDALETLLSILRSMKNDGNIPAVDFCERLSSVQAGVSSLRALGRVEESELDVIPSGSQSIGNETIHSDVDHSQAASMDVGSHGSVDILGNPLMDGFLQEDGVSWTDALFAEDGTLKQFASEMEEQFRFYM